VAFKCNSQSNHIESHRIKLNHRCSVIVFSLILYCENLRIIDSLLWIFKIEVRSLILYCENLAAVGDRIGVEHRELRLKTLKCTQCLLKVFSIGSLGLFSLILCCDFFNRFSTVVFCGHARTRTRARAPAPKDAHRIPILESKSGLEI
jgi:hypothetical protein